MSDELAQLCDKLQQIKNETNHQIRLLREDTTKVDMTRLVDLTAEIEEIVVNPCFVPQKDYPQIIANYIADNPLTIHELENLIKIIDDFTEFLKS